MTEKIKQSILNPTQKKRYQISAEYFSRGVANELKNKFNSPQLKDIEKIVGKIKKEKEVDEEKEKSKKSVIGKIAILSGLVISGVLLFKNLNNLFHDNKKQKTNISEEITYKLDETKIDNSTKELNETLRKSYIEGFSTPLIDGIKLLTSINPSTLGEELTRGLTEDQLLHNVIIGQVLYNITLAATWHVFEKRGYEFILATFDFPMADRVYFNVGMWRKYKADPTQYAHVGRDLVNSSIKGAEIQEVSSENYLNIISGVDFLLTDISHSERFGLLYNKDVKYHEGENGIVHPSEIFNMINNNPVFLRNGRSRTYSRNTPIREIKITRETSRQIPITNDYIEDSNTKTDYTWIPFAHYVEDWNEFDDGGLPPTVVRAPEEFKFINKQWDYVYEMYQFNKTNQTIQQLLPTYESLIQPNPHSNDKNKFWSMGDLVKLVQLSYYAAEWELYQALQSINSTRGLYQEIFRKQQVDILTNKIAQRELELRRQAENFQIDYANGQIDVQEVVSRMKESILEISKKPLKWIENDIKFHSNSYKKQIPYINIKEMVGRIKREVLRLGVSGTKEENVLVLDNQSLRDNFDLTRRANVDANLGIEGQQFSWQRKGDTYFSSHNVPSYISKKLGNREKGRVWLGGTNFVDVHGSFPERSYGQQPVEVFYDDENSMWRPYGTDVKDGWLYLHNTDVKLYPVGRMIDNIGVRNGKTESWKTQVFEIRLENVGYEVTFVYESIVKENNKYNLYLDYVTQGYYNDSYIDQYLSKREKSTKSHAAIYQGEYDTDKLDELYALPLESLERNLKDVADYVNQELLQAYEERNKLIEEIHDQCIVDSQDQNLRILIISK